MPQLLHEFWENERGKGGHFHPVKEENDRLRPQVQPNARLAFSLWASSWFEAMQLYQERMDYGDFWPPEGVPDHVYSKEEADEQEAYLRTRKV
jgi:hypothetical protein